MLKSAVGFSISVVFLTQIVGVNLGLHSVLGYVESFSRAARAFDLCMTSQDDMHTVFQESALQTRTPELFNQQVRDLASGKTTVPDCAVTRPSAFAVLPYYHPACNDSVELMHDLAGVLQLETKLIFVSFIVSCEVHVSD